MAMMNYSGSQATAALLRRYCGATATTAPTYSLNDACARTSQLVGLDFSTGRAISLAPGYGPVWQSRE
jgi:hypothetical protein